MNRPSPWLFETPAVTQPEYENALKTEWEMRPPRRAMSRPAPRPTGRPSRTSRRSTSRPVSRSSRRPPKGQITPRHRQPVPVGHSQLDPINSSAPAALGAGTTSPRIKIATIDLFEFGSYLLKKHQFEQLVELLILLDSNKDLLANIHLSFRGHTDNMGGDSSNLLLSGRRAMEVEGVVQRYFRKEHPNLATTVHLSSATEPIAPNTTKDGQARNRRVEVFSDVPLQPSK